MRHGKFGTTLGIKREDGSNKMVTNIYASNIDVDGPRGKQTRKPTGPSVKNKDVLIEKST